MILKFIKIALKRISKLETNFASFPNIGHDGATVLRFDFLDNFLEQSQPSLELLAKPRSEGFLRHCAGAIILIHPAKGQH